MRESYYKPSGKVTVAYVLFFLLFVAISIPVLGAVYAYLVYYMPIIILNVGATFGCGCALGFVIAQAAKLGKTRNPTAVIVMAVVAVALMKYVQWCFYVPLVYDEYYGAYIDYFGDYVDLTLGEQLYEALWHFLNPAEVYSSVLEINEIGVWGMSSSGSSVPTSNVTGIVLWVVWLGEFAILLVSAIFTSKGRPAFPFSEESDAWYTAMKETVEMDMPADFAYMKSRMEGGDMSGLIALSASGMPNPANFIRVSFFLPPQPALSATNYMDIDQVAVVQQKRKQNTKVTKLVRYLAIGNNDMMKVIRREGADGDQDGSEDSSGDLDGSEDADGDQGGSEDAGGDQDVSEDAGGD
jgi:hypothetical protein